MIDLRSSDFNFYQTKPTVMKMQNGITFQSIGITIMKDVTTKIVSKNP